MIVVTKEEKRIPLPMSEELDPMRPRDNAALTVDIIIEQVCNGQVYILLIKRKKEPFKGLWALPGGHLEATDQNLWAAILRETEEETGITNLMGLIEVGTYSDLGRDPRPSRYVSDLFFASVPQGTIAKPGSDADEVCWFPVNDLPPLAFDHEKMIKNTIL